LQCTPNLCDAIGRWRDATFILVGPVVRSERGRAMTPVSIVNWFSAAYQAIGLEGCSSHSTHENRRQALSPELADEDAVAVSVAREWQ